MSDLDSYHSSRRLRNEEDGLRGVFTWTYRFLPKVSPSPKVSPPPLFGLQLYKKIDHYYKNITQNNENSLYCANYYDA